CGAETAPGREALPGPHEGNCGDGREAAPRRPHADADAQRPRTPGFDLPLPRHDLHADRRKAVPRRQVDRNLPPPPLQEAELRLQSRPDALRNGQRADEREYGHLSAHSWSKLPPSLRNNTPHPLNLETI